jgi:hypothetical protein
MEQDTNIASLIYWKNIEDKERILRWLQKLQEEGRIESHTTQTYYAPHGEPVWYIP